MANRYWVGGTGAWDGTAGTKWSDTSGGTGGASVPTSADDVFFDSASGASVVTVSAGNTGAKTITCTGFTGTITGSTGITVAGSVTLAASMTFTPTATWTISGTGTITSAGKTFNEVRIDGAGITVSLGDNLLITNALTVTRGTFDTTASNYSITASSIISANSNTRTINLNGSTVTLTTTATIINFSITTNLTFNAGTSQINCTTVSGFVSIAGGGVTFYNLSLPPSSTNTSNHTITGANIFNNLTISSPVNAGVGSCSFDANQTINGTLTLTGATAIRRAWIRSNLTGIVRTLTVATLSAQNCDFRDITIAGAAAGSSPTRAGDCGNNSGIVFPAAKTVYWNLAGAGANFSSTGWALTNNGTPDINNFPLAQDTAAFTDSGSAGTISFIGGFNIGTIDASARTTAATLNFNGTMTFYGSFTLGSGITVSGTNTQTFSGTGTMLFTSAGKTISFDPRIEATGTFRLGDALNSTDVFTLIQGGFVTDNYDVTITQFVSQAANVRTLILGTSTINLIGNGAVWNLSTATNLTFSGASSTINLTNQTSVARTFSGSGLTYGTLNIGGALGTSTLTISNSSGTFATLSSTKTVAHTISFTALCTITNWTVTGTPGNVVTVNSSPAGTLRSITYGGGQINLDYMSFQDIYFNYTLDASNPYRVYAGANSTNGGNNVGIAFIDGTTKKAYLLTSGTTWTVPGDWTNTNNIYLIGGGGAGTVSATDGDNRAAGGGGGGGGYTAITNFFTTAGSTINYAIGAGGTSGTGTNGGDTTWNSGASTAGGGSKGNATSTPSSSGGAGGTGTFAGGTGGVGAFGTAASTGYGSVGGGGAGGPNGVGGNGGNGFASTTAANIAGGGGGGNGGGTNGGNASSATGGAGGNNFSGVGGGATNSAVGTFGGGGAGGVTAASGNGGSGIDIQNTLGGAGGKGGAGNSAALDNAGLYGGGGAGGRVPTTGGNAGGFAGSQGVIFIVYDYVASVASYLSGITISGVTLRAQ